MSQIGIRMPTLVSPKSGSPFITKEKLKEAASQSWLAGALVQVTGTGASAKLQRCAADATACYGMAPQAARGSGVLTPPDALFRDFHYPYDLDDCIIEINASNGSLSGANIGANGVTFAGGGTGGVALAPGQQYGIITLTSGTYSGYQLLDVTETSSKLFEIVRLAPNNGSALQTVDDNNPRLWVRILRSALQG